MRTGFFARRGLPGLLALLVAGPLVAGAGASSQFNGARWETNGRGLSLELGSELDNGWDSYLNRSANEWSQSRDVNLRVAGSGGNTCQMERGRVEVCNGTYRNDRWLGLTIADIDGNRNIYRALVLMNDYYFDQNSYDRSDAKRHTMCQEVGHAMGLDHRYSKTCMNDREIFGRAYDSPSNADYDRLADLYDGRNRSASTADAARTAPAADTPEPVDPAFVEDVVAEVEARGEDATTAVEDLGGGRKRIIHITRP